jgi:hypothetical protein
MDICRCVSFSAQMYEHEFRHLQIEVIRATRRPSEVTDPVETPLDPGSVS